MKSWFQIFCRVEDKNNSSNNMDQISHVIQQLIENKDKEQNLSEQDHQLLSQLLSQVEVLKKKEKTYEDPSSLDKMAFSLPTDTRKADHNEEKLEVCESKEKDDTDDITRQLKKIQRQNLITHCLLSALIVVTVVWQLSELSLLRNLNHSVTRPFRTVGSLFGGAFAGLKRLKNQDKLFPNSQDHELNASSRLSIEVPELPHVDLPTLHFGDDSKTSASKDIDCDDE